MIKRKEIFYLMTHSTHLWLYGVIHMVKDHSDSKRERGNPLLPLYGLILSVSGVTKAVVCAVLSDSVGWRI